MKKEKGFTLIEVMIAMLIFLLILGGMLPVFLSFAKFNTASQTKSEAMNAASYVLDQLRLTDPLAMPTAGATTSETVSIGSKDFTVTTAYCSDMTYCGTVNNRHILVRVNYKGKQLYAVETVFTQLR